MFFFLQKNKKSVIVKKKQISNAKKLEIIDSLFRLYLITSFTKKSTYIFWI